MRRIIFGLTALIAVLATIGLTTGSANAYTAPAGSPSYIGTDVNGTTIQTIDMEVHLDAAPVYYHQYDLTFQPAVDGVVIFSGVGKQFDNGGETITGSVDTVNHTVTWVAQYLNLATGLPEVGNTWGVTDAPYVVGPTGDFDWTGISDQHQSGYALTGVIRNVPAALPVVAAGNHGECVSGATHAGIKGKALAAIAGDKTKVGEYGSATCVTLPGFAA